MDHEPLNRKTDDSPTASWVGIGIPALVIAAAIGAYLLIPRTDAQYSQTQSTPPASSQQAPKATPSQEQVTPSAEQKAPPSAQPKSNDVREPRTDSQNSN